MEANTYQEHIAAAEKLVAEATKLMNEGMNHSGQMGTRFYLRADALNNIAQSHIMLAQIKTWIDSGERAIG